MKDYTIIGYSYESDVHCVACAVATFGSPWLNREDTLDADGNPVCPIFAGDEGLAGSACGDCGEALV